MVDLMNWNMVIGLFLSVILIGCSAKENFVVLSPAEDGSVGELTIATNTGSAVLNEPGKAIFVSDPDSKPSEPTPISEEETREIFATALEVHPLTPISFVLYFKHNSKELTEESEALIPVIKNSVSERASADISIIGHTDRTGEEDYNMTLSLERAEEVYEILITRGFEINTMSITSHGEGNPLIPTADNVPEPRNRRVEILVR